MHKLKIEPLGEFRHRVYVDEKEVKCRGVDIRLRDDEMPTVMIDVVSEDNIEIEGILEVSNENLLRMIARRTDDREFCDKVWRMIAER